MAGSRLARCGRCRKRDNPIRRTFYGNVFTFFGRCVWHLRASRITHLAVAARPPHFLHSLVPTGQPRDRPVVLVVDGNQDVREMYCTYFTYVGYECVGAASGDEALRLLHDRVPDLVLLEESLPGIDGWQLLKMIRTDAKLRSVRVVVLTADVFEAPR